MAEGTYLWCEKPFRPGGRLATTLLRVQMQGDVLVRPPTLGRGRGRGRRVPFLHTPEPIRDGNSDRWEEDNRYESSCPS